MGSAQGAITSGQDADPAGGGNRAMRLNGHAQRMKDKILPEIKKLEAAFENGSLMDLPKEASLSEENDIDSASVKDWHKLVAPSLRLTMKCCNKTLTSADGLQKRIAGSNSAKELEDFVSRIDATKAKAEALKNICTVVIDKAAAPQDLITAFGQGRELQVHLPLELIEHEFLIRGRSLFSFENWEAILCLLQESGDAFTHLHEQGSGRMVSVSCPTIWSQIA